MRRALTRSLGALRTARASYLSTATRPQSPLVTTTEAAGLIDDANVRFLDIRDPRQFDEAHVPGAANCVELFTYLAFSNRPGVAHMQRTFEKLLRAKGLSGDERIICYEDSLRTMYGASCRAWYVLHTLGLRYVQVLDGGWQLWRHNALPVCTKPEAACAEGKFTARFDDSRWIDFKGMTQLGADEKLLDVRDQVEWDAHSSSPYGVDFAPRMGRLHGAIHVEWYNFMQDNDDGVSHFKEPAEIREVMAQNGFELGDRIVLYCFKGARASNTLMALTLAGFQNVRMYFASWNEWSRIEDAPYDNTKLGAAPLSNAAD